MNALPKVPESGHKRKRGTLESILLYGITRRLGGLLSSRKSPEKSQIVRKRTVAELEDRDDHDMKLVEVIQPTPDVIRLFLEPSAYRPATSSFPFSTPWARKRPTTSRSVNSYLESSLGDSFQTLEEMGDFQLLLEQTRPKGPGSQRLRQGLRRGLRGSQVQGPGQPDRTAPLQGQAERSQGLPVPLHHPLRVPQQGRPARPTTPWKNGWMRPRWRKCA